MCRIIIVFVFIVCAVAVITAEAGVIIVLVKRIGGVQLRLYGTAGKCTENRSKKGCKTKQAGISKTGNPGFSYAISENKI